MRDICKEIRDLMNGQINCPVCGEKPKIKISFIGRKIYRNKRKTQYCKCGWSCILPTEREAMIQLNLI